MGTTNDQKGSTENTRPRRDVDEPPLRPGYRGPTTLRRPPPPPRPPAPPWRGEKAAVNDR